MAANKVDNADGGFSESWLTLREPADHKARSPELNQNLTRWSRQHEAIQIVELGSGTGSNLRFLSPLLGHNQQWRLIDNDASLLNHLPTLLKPWADQHKANLSSEQGTLVIKHDAFSARVSTEVIDLANELEQLSLEGVDLLTASALLDLTSESWLNVLANRVVESACACLFVLNYNGTIQWQPALPSDAEVTELLNQHQLGDKGFGPALGPGAGLHIAHMLEKSGRHVQVSDSDWQLDNTTGSLQQAIIDGWAPAAKEQDSTLSTMIDQWHKLRQQNIEKRLSQLRVGHVDVLSLP